MIIAGGPEPDGMAEGEYTCPICGKEVTCSNPIYFGSDLGVFTSTKY